MLATALGVALVFGPWIVRLVGQLGDERRERIRSEERADMAAHLHDSVLQTLALIQRNADAALRGPEPRPAAGTRAAGLAVRRPPPTSPTDAPGTLASALDRLDRRGRGRPPAVEVDVVLVGDCPLDPGSAALVKAVREAVVNAANHSGADEVSVYVEVRRRIRVEAFVRDRGRGFDPAAVDDDRQGITRSIVGRMARHGGRAAGHQRARRGHRGDVRGGPGASPGRPGDRRSRLARAAAADPGVPGRRPPPVPLRGAGRAGRPTCRWRSWARPSTSSRPSRASGAPRPTSCCWTSTCPAAGDGRSSSRCGTAHPASCSSPCP